MKIEPVWACSFHFCRKECSKDLKEVGDCMCHNMNWDKANKPDGYANLPVSTTIVLMPGEINSEKKRKARLTNKVVLRPYGSKKT